MSGSGSSAWMADLVLVVHFLFVSFVIIGFLLILIGRLFGWPWIYLRVLRVTHLLAIGFVVVQSYFGQLCPLTLWENALRSDAGQAGYEGSFIQYWLQRILYFDAEPWVFGTIYTVFGVLVVAATVWDWKKIGSRV